MFKNLQNYLFTNPYRACAVVAFWTFVLSIIGLGNQEFIRHTEADRTLIAWEIVEGKNFLVPTLLGSDILTKPPLYYWFSAFTLYLTNVDSEFYARLPSVFSGVLFVIFQFFSWYRISKSIKISATASLALVHSVLFFILIASAEIDMLFGLLTYVSIGSSFFLMEERNLKFLALFALSTSLAFLTKGPPVFFFLLGGILPYLFIRTLVTADKNFYKQRVLFLIFGLIASVVLVLSWLIPLGQMVGFAELLERFREEVLRRVVNYSERERGSFFYFGAVIVNTLPWSIFLIISLVSSLFFIKNFKKNDVSEIESVPWSNVFSKLCADPKIKEFAIFHTVIFLMGFLMLSIAQGKSSRYCFPILPSFINVVILFGGYSLRPAIFKWFSRFLKTFSTLAVVAGVTFFVFSRLDGVDFGNLILGLGVAIVVNIIILLSSQRTIWKYFPIYIGLVFFAVRVCQSYIYVPFRNHTRSVKNLSTELVAELGGKPLYTVEAFERWTVYYAKKLGLKTFRLSPEKIQTLKSDGTTNIYLLLDYDEEAWRYYQLLIYSPSTELIKVFPHPTSSIYLLKVPVSILDNLKVLLEFPTHPSFPFYSELESRELLK